MYFHCHCGKLHRKLGIVVFSSRRVLAPDTTTRSTFVLHKHCTAVIRADIVARLIVK
jgi:hypothetical protein